MYRFSRRSGVRCGCLLAVAVGLSSLLWVPASAQKTPDQAGLVRIEIQAKPLIGFLPRDPQQRRFGALEFRGGLELSSSHKDFGGISSIRVERDGQRFLAVTDKGRWLRGNIRYSGKAPVGIADAEMAPIRGPDGRPITSRRWYDSEALALDDAGIAYVGIERVHQILWFDYGKHGLLARGQPMRVPPEMKQLPSNKGIEGLVVGPKGSALAGALIAVSEKGLDSAGNIRGFIIGGPTPGVFTIKRSDEFDITDLALAPGGDLLVLERSFSFLRGAGLRIRRIALAAVTPGALLDGPVLLRADSGYQIDNMEGLSVHTTPDGDTVLTLISDDNFSRLQRTLLLQFTLVEQ